MAWLGWLLCPLWPYLSPCSRASLEPILLPAAGKQFPKRSLQRRRSKENSAANSGYFGTGQVQP